MQKDQAACTTGTTTYWLECPNTTHIVCFSSNNKIPKNQIPSQKNTPKPCIAAASAAAAGGSYSTSYTINQHLSTFLLQLVSLRCCYSPHPSPTPSTRQPFSSSPCYCWCWCCKMQQRWSKTTCMICSPNSLTTPNPSPPQKKHTHTHNNNNNSFSSRSSSSSASRSSRFAHLNLANKTRIKPQTTMMIMMILMRLVVAIVVRILDSCCDWSERPKVRGHKSSCIPIGCEEISRLLADDSQAKSALWRQWESVLSYIPPKMDDWLNEWMNGWMDEWMNGWMNQWMNDLERGLGY